MSSPAATAEDEAGKSDVVRWRHEQLERAGYPPLAALELAVRRDVDLHYACELLERGATVDQALGILR